MAHEIWNGRAIYTGAQAEVWHEIGVYVGGRKLTSEDILAEAGLDYPVYKLPMMMQRSDGSIFPTKNVAVCRDGVAEDIEGDGNPVQLGTVTSNYEILQNRDAFRSFDPLVEAGLIEYTAAGALMNGARVWIAARLTDVKRDEMVVRHTKTFTDTVEAYWLLYNGHDGATAVNINLTAIRPVCFNTVSAAMFDSTYATTAAQQVRGNAGVKARHARNVVANVDAAVKSLEATHERFRTMMDTYRAMADVKLTDAITERFFKLTFPVVEGEVWSKRRSNQIEEMQRLAIEGVGNGGNSLWDLFNGVTEYFDHNGADPMANMNSSWFGTRADQRDAAMTAARKILKAA